jgi:hypothetical protein
MLNLSDITSKFHTVPMFTTVKIQNTFHMQLVTFLITCFHTKFDEPSSNIALVITTKQKAKYRFHVAAKLFYIIQKNHPNQSCIFYI